MTANFRFFQIDLGVGATLRPRTWKSVGPSENGAAPLVNEIHIDYDETKCILVVRDAKTRCPMPHIW